MFQQQVRQTLGVLEMKSVFLLSDKDDNWHSRATIWQRFETLTIHVAEEILFSSTRSLSTFIVFFHSARVDVILTAQNTFFLTYGLSSACQHDLNFFFIATIFSQKQIQIQSPSEIEKLSTQTHTS